MKNCRSNMSRRAFREAVFTAAIKRRRNPPEKRRIKNEFTE